MVASNAPRGQKRHAWILKRRGAQFADEPAGWIEGILGDPLDEEVGLLLYVVDRRHHGRELRELVLPVVRARRDFAGGEHVAVAVSGNCAANVTVQARTPSAVRVE